jgi:primase/DNA polymerase family protein
MTDVTVKQFAAVPEQLKRLPNWLGWRYVSRGGKETKPPVNVRTGDFGSSNDPASWASFQDACAALTDPSKHLDGIGISLVNSRYAGLDFDGVVDTPEDPLVGGFVVEPFVLEILKLLQDPYYEISPSGNGIRAFFECDALPKVAIKTSAKKEGVMKYGAELYRPANDKGARYLTITADQAGGNGIPRLTLDEMEIPLFLIGQFGNAKLKRLWLGDTSAYGNDHSSADLALCNLLLKHLDADERKVDRFFRASLLFRDKWDEIHDGKRTYGAMTIAKAKAAKVAPSTTVAAPAELEFHVPAVTAGTAYDYVLEPAEGEFDGWLPLGGSASLVGGLSGTNKTTLMMQLLQSQLYKEPFLGHATNGRPYLILMADRGEDSHKRTMRRMRLDPCIIPIKFLSSLTGLAALQQIVNRIEGTTPLPQIVFVEGADMLVDDGNKKQFVVPSMNGLREIATHFHLALVASVGAPKSKPGEGYVAKRDNISGTEAWGRLAETVMILQYPQGKDTAFERDLSVLPRNAPAESFHLILDQGRLRPQTDDDLRNVKDEKKELHWAMAQARLATSDATKKWWTTLDMMRGLSMTPSTAYRWIKDACLKNYVVEKPGAKGKGRGKAGLYRWNDSKTNPLWSPEAQQELV